MKTKPFFLAFLLCSFLNSCERDDSYSVNLIRDSVATTILPQNQIDSIKYLFEYNHLDYSNYKFHSFLRDELGYHHVKCYQFRNNLKLFSNELIFHFNEKDSYYYLSGKLVEKVALDSKPRMNYNNVAAKFVRVLEQDDSFLENKEKIKSSCFDVEFGYYELNESMSNVPNNIVKAWKIKPTNSDYPYAYINDANLDVILYDKGFRY